MCIEGTGVALAAVTSWYAIMNHCVLELLCGTIDTNMTELKEDIISHTATDTQLPCTATSDHSRTLSELHHNDEKRAPVIMYLFSHQALLSQ